MKGFSGVIDTKNAPRLRRSYGVYNDKFPADKANYSDARYDVMLDGVVLNFTALREKYGGEDMPSLLLALWEQKGEELRSELKGSFVLCLWDKQKDTVFLCNDRLSKRPLYYYQVGDKTWFSSRYLDLVSLLAESGVSMEYDPAAAAMMSKYGYLHDRFTWVRGLYCLRPYEYLLLGDGHAPLRGAEPPFTQSREPEALLRQRFTALFREAVRLQYEKNREGGYRQTITLSGGMDSRSVALMGEKLGYRAELACCYAQSGSVDEKIARKLARRLGCAFLFYPMDRAGFLLQPEAHARQNEGEMSYCGATGAYTVSTLLDKQGLGVLHTGLLGGELLAAIYGEDTAHPARDPFHGQAGPEYAACLPGYASEGQRMLRDLMRACLNLARMFQYTAEPLSPFMDEDVYEFVRTLSLESRRSRAFYIRWMRQELPNRLVTTYCCTPVGAPLLVQRAARVLNDRLVRLRGQTVFSMNPCALWFRQTPGLGEAIVRFTEKYGQNTLPPALREPLLEKSRAADGQPSLLALSGLLAAWLTDEAAAQGRRQREEKQA